ncbi:putative fructosamine kinase [Aspergillus clavatus NRRL 1]|uniref:protein-ribulosamine 3-kinase n=1 Tax=Aspergillus clavatus (strain ATCC 1007 / CBS 513.65 / DSM 816 / NCTC 3887 / NRRL 1 / QM 1276 / 107) TaxID=344612 RepID=A1CQW0_ASPCL|nr:fructosamine kinase, putative [Aspergillus clavatus NRRL 1]EAW08031.1 fructosamine kinase, putative [Aspergillus clavatus NRRL 1]
MAPVPASILRALSLPDASKASLSTTGLGSGFTSTGAIHATIASADGTSEEERRYFVKTSADGTAAEEMFRGEYESLNAIAHAVPGLCPRALAWGPLDEHSKANSNPTSKSFFLVTEFLELGGGGGGRHTGPSLAQRLAQLHSTPAPPDPATGRRRFGFPVPTFCGDSRQLNRWRDSWAEFYAEERLLMILERAERRHGPDGGLRALVERTAGTVVPALLGEGHLGYARDGKGEGIVPVVVHGDLWSGNAGRGRIVGTGSLRGRGRGRGRGRAGDEEEEEEVVVGDVVYDPSACYAHREYELGIMRMFGGFGAPFFEAYHRIVPKTEPVEEYDDRVRLYELYHHLNHHAIFGAGYRSGAVSIMEKLLKKSTPYHNEQSFLALNPRGLVPTLGVHAGEDDKAIKPLYESNVIREYLKDAYPDHQPRLLPSDSYEKARARILMDFVSSRRLPKDQLSFPDLALAPWAVRLWAFDGLKTGGLGIPAEGQEGEDKAVWQRWRKWLRAVEEREGVKATTSEKGHYLPIYTRYAENTAQSELAKATRAGTGVP